MSTQRTYDIPELGEYKVSFYSPASYAVMGLGMKPGFYGAHGAGVITEAFDDVDKAEGALLNKIKNEQRDFQKQIDITKKKSEGIMKLINTELGLSEFRTK
ncbi:MAG: hypothetical protein V1888_02820 [archaeon]